MKKKFQTGCILILALSSAAQTGTHGIGKISYELTDHLGNVVATISDMANYDAISGTTTARLESCNNYYAFGMEMPGRNYSSPNYRYGYNGKEKDDELKGSANSLDYGARIYDPRIARWLSNDPLQAAYPGLSPYNYVANNPIMNIDPDGRKIKPADNIKAEYNEAYKYLKSKKAASVLDELVARDEVIKIEMTNSVTQFDADKKTIYWHPNQATIPSDGSPIISPATGLNHEADHALSFLKDPAGFTKRAKTPDPIYSNEEEKRVIQGSEKDIRRKIGEISATSEGRQTHTSQYYLCQGPTSIALLNGKAILLPNTATVTDKKKLELISQFYSQQNKEFEDMYKDSYQKVKNFKDIKIISKNFGPSKSFLLTIFEGLDKAKEAWDKLPRYEPPRPRGCNLRID